MKLKDITGQKFYDLRVLYRVSSDRHGKSRWMCRCDCGEEKIFSSDHLTRKRNPVKSCGCKRIRSGSEHHQWSGCGDISGNWWYNHVKRDLFGKERRAYLEGDLTIDQAWDLFLEQDKKCALTGLELTIGDRPEDNASLDRIDSSIGYTLSNVQWVHKDINKMKNIYSDEYFRHMCFLVAMKDEGW